MDSVQQIVKYILEYGTIFIFFIVYMEYCNLPALPGGVIFPAIGVFIAQSGYSMIYILMVTVLAGLLGSITLYYVGYFVGTPLIAWLIKKFPKITTSINKVKSYSERFGGKGVFICRLLPVVRTIVSLISGTLKEDIVEFTVYSSLGITIWNFGLILLGYLTTKAIL